MSLFSCLCVFQLTSIDFCFFDTGTFGQSPQGSREKASENSDTAAELAEDVSDLVKIIHETIEIVRRSLTSMEKSHSEGQNAFLKPDRYETPGLFNKLVAELER